jgi:hypothetical protein
VISFGAKITLDKTKALAEDIKRLITKRVLVGVPEEKTERKDKGKITNAALARIHDKGSPLQGIPARPFMNPGIKKVQDKISKEFAAAASQVLDGKDDTTNLNRAGLVAASSIKSVINDGDDFAPLKRSSKLARLRKLKAYKKMSKDQIDAQLATMHPLVDTAQMRNSITYVVEVKK